MLVHIASNLLGRVYVPVSILVVTSFVLGMVLAGGYAGDSWSYRDSFHNSSGDSMDSFRYSLDGSYRGHFNQIDSSNSWSSSNLMKSMLRSCSIAIGCWVRGAAVVLGKEDTVHIDQDRTRCCTGKHTAGKDLNIWQELSSYPFSAFLTRVFMLGAVWVEVGRPVRLFR